MHDLVIVGGGILGLAAGREWLRRHPGSSLVLVEKEPRLAAHQTGHNSGVLHSGLYYAPGTRKAANCRRGKAALEAWARTRGVPFERVGKLVVATDASELGALADLEARGRAHGVELRRVDAGELRRIEPAAAGVAALHLPETGIIDYRAVAEALGEELREAGAELRLGCEVLGIDEAAGETRVRLAGGEELATLRVLCCAGLQADRVARRGGLAVDRGSGPRSQPVADGAEAADGSDHAATPRLRTVPFLGQYFDLTPERAAEVRGLIYPVPDPRLPFLGVHLTRRMPSAEHPAGSVDAGPNAVLALARERYTSRLPHLVDATSALTWPGTWRLIARHGPAAVSELAGSFSRAAFCRRAARLLPGLEPQHLLPREPGIRAQALGHDGALIDDYAFARRGTTLHLLNAPSPAATSCLAIAEELVEKLER